MKKTIKKRICDLTPAEKALYLERVKAAMIREQGVAWEKIEPKIRASIDETFDDEKFSKMDTEFAIDAAYARNYFKWHERHEKPSLIDYMLYVGEFVTHSDLIDLPVPDDHDSSVQTSSVRDFSADDNSAPTATTAYSIPTNEVEALSTNITATATSITPTIPQTEAASGQKAIASAPEKKSRKTSATGKRTAKGTAKKTGIATKTGTTKKKTETTKRTGRKRNGPSTIEKIQMLAKWVEETMMPPAGSSWEKLTELKCQLFDARTEIEMYPEDVFDSPAF